LAECLETEKPLREKALEDLKLAENASKLDLDETVKHLADLDKKVKSAQEMVRPRGADATEGQDPERGLVNDAKFEEPIRSFALEGRSQLSLLIDQRDRILVLVTRICETFGEKPKTPVAETLKKLSAFKKDLEDARRNNLLARAKKEKAERRAAEKATAAANKAAAASGAANSAVNSANTGGTRASRASSSFIAICSKASPLSKDKLSKGIVEKTSMPATKILGRGDRGSLSLETSHSRGDRGSLSLETSHNDACLKDKQKVKSPGEKPLFVTAKPQGRSSEKHKAHERGGSFLSTSLASTDMPHGPSSAG